MKYSYPKHKIKILLLENIHTDAALKLEKAGFSVETLDRSLSEDELIDRIKDIHILGIRSKTNVTERVINSSNKLLSICAFCIGTTQIDLSACQKRGIVVYNAPYSNTRSVVELAIGEMIMLMRSTFDKSQQLHNGIWNKTASGSNEIRGKKLGILGYGNIGKQISVIAESLGMEVYYYDISEKLALGNAKKSDSMKSLFETCDIITVHVDDNPNNKNLISDTELSWLKKDAVFINLSRGFVVNLDHLANALNSGNIKGAAIDVYPSEPRLGKDTFENPLMGISNVILTPHIGGSTEEAQCHIANYVSNKIIDYINTGNSSDAVNFPGITLPQQSKSKRFLHIHRNVPGIMSDINTILTKHNFNIVGQYLKTDEEIGYLITDVDTEYSPDAISELKEIENTVKFRVLY